MSKRTPKGNQKTPRPFGLTPFIEKKRKSNRPLSQQDIQEVYRYVVKEYIIQGQTLMGIPLSLPQLGHYLSIDQGRLQVLLSGTLQSIGKFIDPNKVEGTVRACLSEALFWALGDRGRVQHQYDILQAQQGSQYVPFLSKEVNQTLKLLLESQKPIQELAKIMMGSGPQTSISILNQNQQAQSTHTETKYMTISGAVEALEERGMNEIPRGEKLEELGERHEISKGPEVVATKMVGKGNEVVGDLKILKKAKRPQANKRRATD